LDTCNTEERTDVSFEEIVCAPIDFLGKQPGLSYRFSVSALRVELRIRSGDTLKESGMVQDVFAVMVLDQTEVIAKGQSQFAVAIHELAPGIVLSTGGDLISLLPSETVCVHAPAKFVTKDAQDATRFIHTVLAQHTCVHEQGTPPR